jgi:hypothetical protein
MNLSVRHLMIVSIAGFFISLIVHILAVLNIYAPPNFVTILLTAGIIIIWLESSKNVKRVFRQNEAVNPWKNAFAVCPARIKYLTCFLILYAFINFVFIMSFKSGEGYIDASISFQKLRGISGFWLAFYALGLSVGYSIQNFRNRSQVQGS